MAKNAFPPLSIDREAASEAIDLLGQVERGMGDLPHTKAAPLIQMVDAVMQTLLEACPGGYGSLCEGCETLIGPDEVSATTEDGGVLCGGCTTSAKESEELAARNAAEELQLMRQLERAPGWEVITSHSATLRIAERLAAKAEVVVKRVYSDGWFDLMLTPNGLAALKRTAKASRQ